MSSECLQCPDAQFVFEACTKVSLLGGGGGGLEEFSSKNISQYP